MNGSSDGHSRREPRGSRKPGNRARGPQPAGRSRPGGGKPGRRAGKSPGPRAPREEDQRGSRPAYKNADERTKPAYKDERTKPPYKKGDDGKKPPFKKAPNRPDRPDRPARGYSDRASGRSTKKSLYKKGPRPGISGKADLRGNGRVAGALSKPGGEAELPRQWVTELRHTAKAGTADRAVEAIVSAMEAFSSDDFARSAALGEIAKKCAPRSGLTRELLGLAYYRDEKWHEAARELLTYRRLTGSLDENHVIADCYRALGRPDRALEIVEEVKQADVDPEIWAELAIVAAGALADKGERQRALARLMKADLRPRSVQEYHLRLWYVQADLLEKLGQAAAARRAWEQIVSEDPGFFDAEKRLQASQD